MVILIENWTKSDQNQYVTVPTAYTYSACTYSIIEKNFNQMIATLFKVTTSMYNSNCEIFCFTWQDKILDDIWNSQMRTEKDLADSFFRQNVATMHTAGKIQNFGTRSLSVQLKMTWK